MQDAVRPDPQITRLARTTSRLRFPQGQPRVHAMDEALLGRQLPRRSVRRRRAPKRRRTGTTSDGRAAALVVVCLADAQRRCGRGCAKRGQDASGWAQGWIGAAERGGAAVADAAAGDGGASGRVGEGEGFLL